VAPKNVVAIDPSTTCWLQEEISSFLSTRSNPEMSDSEVVVAVGGAGGAGTSGRRPLRLRPLAV
jgi:hypothetical protein